MWTYQVQIHVQSEFRDTCISGCWVMTSERAKETPGPILHAASLLCNELGYHFQISNLEVLFQKGIHQQLISKATGLTLVPD